MHWGETHSDHRDCLWCTLCGSAPRLSETRALLVGINDATLTGPVHDVHSIHTHLQRHFNVSNPTLLLNETATRSQILMNLQTLVSSLQNHDTAIFHFSGHGTNVTDNSPGEESDGKDEVILTHDLHIIRDDHFFSLLHQVPESCTMIMIFDNCSSATMADIPNVYWLDNQRELQQKTSATSDIKGKIICISAAADDKDAFEVGGVGILSSAIIGSLYPGNSILNVLRSCDAICRPYNQTVHVSLCNVDMEHLISK